MSSGPVVTSAAINYSDQASPCPFSTFHRLYMCKLKEKTDWKEYIGVSGSTYHPLVYAKAVCHQTSKHTHYQHITGEVEKVLISQEVKGKTWKVMEVVLLADLRVIRRHSGQLCNQNRCAESTTFHHLEPRAMNLVGCL